MSLYQHLLAVRMSKLKALAIPGRLVEGFTPHSWVLSYQEILGTGIEYASLGLAFPWI
jgi:hypothetical protein